MIDLIIPYYNNPEGLKRTLDSINTDIFYVTVIDDNSTIYPPYNPKAHQVFRYNMNRGPGFARQWGINKTSNPYIMFIDAGDIFTSYTNQWIVADNIKDYPEINVFSYSYEREGKQTLATDNRMHGKVYKREFLEKYNITFSKDSSYLNEDIGFNRTCRIISDAIGNPIYHTKMSFMKQIKDKNSLTQKNNQEALYKNQTRALSLVSIHSINICRKNNIEVKEEINQIAISLYYWFVRTAAERPQFIQEAWMGAKIFYDEFQNEIVPNNLLLGNPKIKQCLSYKNKVSFPINILRFAHDIQLFNEVPKQYIGGD